MMLDRIKCLLFQHDYQLVKTGRDYTVKCQHCGKTDSI